MTTLTNPNAFILTYDIKGESGPQKDRVTNLLMLNKVTKLKSINDTTIVFLDYNANGTANNNIKKWHKILLDFESQSIKDKEFKKIQFFIAPLQTKGTKVLGSVYPYTDIFPDKKSNKVKELEDKQQLEKTAVGKLFDELKKGKAK